MWVIRDKEGDARPVGHGAFDSKKDAIKQLKRYRECDAAHAPYTLYRLSTRKERLKRKLLAQSDAYERDNVRSDGGARYWYAGYARALRDVAGQL